MYNNIFFHSDVRACTFNKNSLEFILFSCVHVNIEINPEITFKIKIGTYGCMHMWRVSKDKKSINWWPVTSQRKRFHYLADHSTGRTWGTFLVYSFGFLFHFLKFSSPVPRTGSGHSDPQDTLCTWGSLNLGNLSVTFDDMVNLGFKNRPGSH